jgi:hypothetical protein
VGYAVGSGMSTFSDLPRYPTDSVDEPNGLSDSDGAYRGAIVIAQVAGELLFIALPLFALLWWIVCLPILLALLISAEWRADHR